MEVYPNCHREFLGIANIHGFVQKKKNNNNNNYNNNNNNNPFPPPQSSPRLPTPS